MARTMFHRQRTNEVLTTSSMAEAVLHLMASPVNACLVGVAESEPAGIEFLRWLRDPKASPCPSVPVAALTDSKNPAFLQKVCRYGIEGLLRKPISQESLTRRVSQIISEPKRMVIAPGYLGPDRRNDDGSEAFAGPERRRPSEPVFTDDRARPAVVLKQPPPKPSEPKAPLPRMEVQKAEPTKLTAQPPAMPKAPPAPPVPATARPAASATPSTPPAPARPAAPTVPMAAKPATNLPPAAKPPAPVAAAAPVPKPAAPPTAPVPPPKPQAAAPLAPVYKPSGVGTKLEMDETSPAVQAKGTKLEIDTPAPAKPAPAQATAPQAAPKPAPPVEAPKPKVKPVKLSFDLNGVLDAHRKWVLSRGVEGGRATLSRQNMTGVDLSGAILTQADLTYCRMTGAECSEARLDGSDLRYADLAGADLTEAILGAARLRHVNLEGATLKGTNLRGADLSGADLRGADFEGAQLHGAIMLDTMINDSDLSTAEGLTQAQINKTRRNLQTKLPPGIRLNLGDDERQATSS